MRKTTNRLAAMGIAALMAAGCQCDSEIEECGAAKWLTDGDGLARSLPFPAGPAGESGRMLRIRHPDHRYGAVARCRHEQERLAELLGLPPGYFAPDLCAIDR